MRALDSADVLNLTERSAGLGPSRIALLILAAGYPEHAPEEISGAPLAARDRALLALRRRMFGAEMTAKDRCEGCGEVLEVSLTADALGLSERDPPFPPAPRGQVAISPSHTVAIRAVTAGDAAAAEDAPDADAARCLLVERVAPGAAPDDALDAALEALDPTADVELAMRCPACDETMVRAFDAAAFFSRELATCAPLILREVAELARAYHWAERDILAMSPARRAFYLAEARR